MYDIINSVAEGHAYDKHVLGEKYGDKFYGISEFNDSNGPFGDSLGINTQDDLARLLLQVINDPKTRSMYDLDQNTITIANSELNVIVELNNSTKHGDAGTIFRTLVDDSGRSRTNTKYNRSLLDSKSGGGLVLESKTPEDTMAFIERYARTKDFSQRPGFNAPVSHANSLKASTASKMLSDRNRAVRLSEADKNAMPSTRVEQLQRHLDQSLASKQKEMDEEKRQAKDENKLVSEQKRRAAQVSCDVIKDVKKGAIITDAHKDEGIVYIEVSDDLFYEIEMSEDGHRAEITCYTAEVEESVLLDTETRINRLKNIITEKEQGLIDHYAWGSQVNGKPLSWMKKAGVEVKHDVPVFRLIQNEDAANEARHYKKASGFGDPGL